MNEKVNYGKGILGGLLFGIIASIPWILINVFVHLFVVYLGALIGLGVIYGYKLYVNKIDKKMPIIVSIIIVFIVVVNAMVIIPGSILIQNGIPFSFSNLLVLYQIEGFLPEFIKDLLISLLFAGLGALPYINSIRLQLMSKNPSDDIKLVYNSSELLVEYMKTIREYFVNNSATDSDHVIAITDDLNFNKIALNNLMKLKAIVEVNGLYYYDLEKGMKIENDFNKSANAMKHPFSKKYFIILLIIVLAIFVISLISQLI